MVCCRLPAVTFLSCCWRSCPRPPAPTLNLHLEHVLGWIHEKVEFFKTFFTNPVAAMLDQVTRCRPCCLSGSPASPKFSCWYNTCSSGWGRAAKAHGAASEKPHTGMPSCCQDSIGARRGCHLRVGARCPFPDSKFVLKVLDFSSCEESISAWQDDEDDGRLGVRSRKEAAKWGPWSSTHAWLAEAT